MLLYIETAGHVLMVQTPGLPYTFSLFWMTAAHLIRRVVQSHSVALPGSVLVNGLCATENTHVIVTTLTNPSAMTELLKHIVADIDSAHFKVKAHVLEAMASPGHYSSRGEFSLAPTTWERLPGIQRFIQLNTSSPPLGKRAEPEPAGAGADV